MNLEIIKNINEKKFDQQLKVCFEKQILLTNVYFGVSMYRYATWFIGLESNNYFKRTYDIIVKEIAHLKNIISSDTWAVKSTYNTVEDNKPVSFQILICIR